MKVFFLVYNSRSGSTFLSKTLSKHYANIIIVPESMLIRNLFLLSEQKVKELTRKDIRTIIDNDYQFESLNISKYKTEEIIYKKKGLGSFIILRGLLEEIHGHPIDNTILIVKTGILINDLSTRLKETCFSGYIYIYRDPRGIINSTISTISPHFKGFKMGRGCIVHSANMLKKFDKKVCEVERLVSVFKIKYEKLKEDLPSLIQKISTKAELDLRSGKGKFELNPKENSIHSKIDKPFDKNRIYAWKHELSAKQIYVIDKVTNNYQQKRGYFNYTTLSSIDKILALLRYYIIEYSIKALHEYYKKLIFFIKNPIFFFTKLKIYKWKLSDRK